MIRAAAGILFRTVLGFYFRRMDLLGAERVPREGPLLVCANHPNSLADAMVLAAVLPRPFGVVATATLFRLRPVAWLLKELGVIAVNRPADDARGMRSVAATFEAVFAVLETGGAVLIFPEGVTYDEPVLKELKSGAARMALELEHRHGGRLGLRLLPVGLAYPARARYRGDAVVQAAEPLRAADFLDGYPERKKDCIRRLGAALEASLKGLVVHQPDSERALVTGGVLRLLGGGGDGAEAVTLRKRTAEAVETAFTRNPNEAREFAARLAIYERGLARMSVDDAVMRGGIGSGPMLARALAAIVLGPAAAWGAVHRWAPLTLTAWAIERFSDEEKLEARVATRALIAGTLSFILIYGALIGLVHAAWGFQAGVWYAVSLPVTGLLAHAYWGEVLRLARHAAGLCRLGLMRRAAEISARRRERLVADIKRWRAET